MRPAVTAEMAHGQDMVGIGDKLLPLTARAGRGGSETKARPPHPTHWPV